MIIYGLKNCDTCRKASKALKAAGIRHLLVDVRDDGIPTETLKRAYDEFSDALLNTRSTTWRGLSEDVRATPALDLLAEYPALMKRPLIDADGTLYLGWAKPTQDALLPER